MLTTAKDVDENMKVNVTISQKPKKRKYTLPDYKQVLKHCFILQKFTLRLPKLS